MRCVWKVTGLGILYELWAKEGLANCVIIWHDILQVCNCNLCLLQLLNFFTCVCIQLISFLFHFQMNTKQRMMNTKHRTNLKFLVHLGKTPSQALEMLKQVYGDNTVSWTRVSEWHKRFKEGCKEVEDDSKSWRPSTSRTQVNIELVKQSAWQSSVDCSNDCKSAGHKKGQCLEDYHWRFGHAESLCKNVPKAAEWWPEGASHADLSGHHLAISKWTRLA